ncbi:CoA transferase [Nocardia sp. KC 131]|uniref:CoA transferase n=1 Tax=Nocardia arseniciresistens TaxID=3392119 RepID=UPI00398E4A3B
MAPNAKADKQFGNPGAALLVSRWLRTLDTRVSRAEAIEPTRPATGANDPAHPAERVTAAVPPATDVTDPVPPSADIPDRVPATAELIGAACPALDWAASGCMDLTGPADGPPVLSPAAMYGLLREVIRALADSTADTGEPVDLDPATALSGRAALTGLRRAGRRSAGGTSRLLRTADGWCAITLSRSDDLDAVPAILGERCDVAPWEALVAAAKHWSATQLADRAQLLGVPAAALPHTPGPAVPWQATRISAPTAGRTLRDCLVIDLSSMWAGPLCAHVLGRAGARIVKVESPHRPDGARADPAFFDRLHAGHEFRTVDFRSGTGRTELAALIDAADIVIEASRPRALAQLGLGPDSRPHHAGQIWLSLTGYGRDDPMRVAFGDDAAVAGGLVGRYEDEPVFCADAVADPLSGICAALAVVGAVRAGGGLLLDLSMRDTAAAFATAPPLAHGPHHVVRTNSGWVVECEHLGRAQPVLAPAAVAGALC